jgi:hypothetical protein
MKISPAHGGHFFCRIKISSRNLKEVHPRNIHTKLQCNPLSHYGEEDFLSFTISYIVKISPTHGGHVFCRIKFFSRNLKEVHPRNIHTKLQFYPESHYCEEEFLKFFTICYILKISPAHGGHVFCRIKISSRNLKEVHPRYIHTK